MNAIGLIDAAGYLGVVVFAISGALAAGRHRMDPVGFVLLGTITAIGGGTMRDMILDRPVFWTVDETQLVLCVVTSLATYFFVPGAIARKRWLAWSDAIGLAAFAVQGSFIALQLDAPPLVAVIMGMMTAVGGGVLRDVLAGDHPMILGGQLYASTAMAGAIVVVAMIELGAPGELSAAAGFLVVLLSRGATLLFDICMGPPGEFLRVGGKSQ